MAVYLLIGRSGEQPKGSALDPAILLTLDEGDDSLAAPLLQFAGKGDIGAESSAWVRRAQIDQTPYDGDMIQFASAVFAAQDLGNYCVFSQRYHNPGVSSGYGFFGSVYLDMYRGNPSAVLED